MSTRSLKYKRHLLFPLQILLICTFLLSLGAAGCKPTNTRIVQIIETGTLYVNEVSEIEISIKKELKKYGAHLVDPDSVRFFIIKNSLNLSDQQSINLLAETFHAKWIMKSSVSKFPMASQLRFTYVITTVILNPASGESFPAVKVDAESYKKFKSKAMKDLAQQLAQQLRNSQTNSKPSKT